MEDVPHEVGQMHKRLQKEGVWGQADMKIMNAEFAAGLGFLKLLIREVPVLPGLRIITVLVINAHIAADIQAIFMINVHIVTFPAINFFVRKKIARL